MNPLYTYRTKHLLLSPYESVSQGECRIRQLPQAVLECRMRIMLATEGSNHEQ